MKTKHFLWLRVGILIAGLVAGIVMRLASVETWKAFLTSFSITIYFELLTLNWEQRATQDTLSRFEKAYPFLIPASVKGLWEHANKHNVFTKWILRHMDIVAAKIGDLENGLYKVQTHMDIQELVELYQDAFEQSPTYRAIGSQDRMVKYFLTVSGKEFLRRLKKFQEDGKLTSVRRFVILPPSEKDKRLQAFIRLHQRLGWELWTIGRNNVAELLPATLQARVNVDSLDAGLYGDTYVCEASAATQDDEMSKLVWLHDKILVEAYNDLADELGEAATLERPPIDLKTQKTSFEEVYEEFRTTCASAN
ncbi:MAG: hypothetical protein ACLQU4_01110 [Limisphaerales bacterium]